MLSFVMCLVHFASIMVCRFVIKEMDPIHFYRRGRFIGFLFADIDDSRQVFA